MPVTTGVSENDQVIIEGIPNVRPGQTVTPSKGTVPSPTPTPATRATPAAAPASDNIVR